MKLSTVRAKLTGSNAVRALAITAVAGAALTMGAPKAQAQHVAFGVQFGVPAYVAPAPEVVYTQPGYYYGDRYAAWRAHEAWERHEAWEHARRFDRDDFRGRDFDRDRFYHERFDHDRFDRR